MIIYTSYNYNSGNMISIFCIVLTIIINMIHILTINNYNYILREKAYRSIFGTYKTMVNKPSQGAIC